MPPERDGRGKGAPPGGRPGVESDTYIEIMPASGGYVKVSAIDARTGTEVCIVGSSKAPQSELERVAISKLRFVMERNAGKKKTPPDENGGSGILI